MAAADKGVDDVKFGEHMASRKGTLLRLGAVAAVAVTAGSVIWVNAISPPTGGGATAQSVLGSGSDTTQFLMSSLDSLYLSSPGCVKVPPASPSPAATPWLDFSCQSPDPSPSPVASENVHHDQVHESYFLGSGNGISQLCSQGLAGIAQIDFARSSRAKKGSDCAGLHFVAYALDGIPWEAFDDGTANSGVHNMLNNSSNTNAVDSGACANMGAAPVCLSLNQLQDVYVNCSITNWSQLGGNNVPISIYTPQAGSGTRATWESFLGGGTPADSTQCIGKNGNGLGNNPTVAAHIVPENANSSIPAGDRAGAIFPFSFGIWRTQVNGSGGSVIGAINNVTPTAATIANQTFPSWRYLFNVFCTASCTRGASSAATVAYVGEEGWICKPGTNNLPATPPTSFPPHGTNPATGNNYHDDIATTITNSGFVPIPSGTIGSGNTNQDYCRLFTT